MKTQISVCTISAALACIVVSMAWWSTGEQVSADQKNPQSPTAPAALNFPNNTNTIVQQDSFGLPQNLAYYDADSGLFIGPGSDPRTTIYSNVPINLFRRHVFVDFEEANTLDPRCECRLMGGATSGLYMGFFRIQTGKTVGSRGELILPNVSAPAYAGQRVYFYLRTYPAGHLRLMFGLQHPQRQDKRICFTRSDSQGPEGLGGTYRAQTSDGQGQVTEVDLGVGAARGGDSVRRLFCINITKSQDSVNRLQGEVEFYVGTDGGILQRKAVLTTHIPDVTDTHKTQHLVPFVSLENTAAVDQTLEIDAIYAVLLR